MAHDNLRWYHALKESSPYSGTRRSLHLAMAMMADKNSGGVTATQAQLAKRLGCSERRVNELIREMSTGVARIGGNAKAIPRTIQILRKGRQGLAGKYRLRAPDEWQTETAWISSEAACNPPAEPRNPVADPRAFPAEPRNSRAEPREEDTRNGVLSLTDPLESPEDIRVADASDVGEWKQPRAEWNDIPVEWEPYVAVAQTYILDDYLGLLYGDRDDWAAIFGALVDAGITADQLQRPLAMDPDGPLLFGITPKGAHDAEIDFWNRVMLEMLVLAVGDDMDFWHDLERDPSLWRQTRRAERAADPEAFRKRLDERYAAISA